MNHFSVLSYNVHKGFSARNRFFVLPQIREALLQLNADILFLQEIQGKVTKTRRLKKMPFLLKETQASYLAAERWKYHVYAKNAIYGAAHHGNALLSKSPILMWENINVAFSRRASRSLLHSIIKLSEDQDLHVICLHLGLFRTERRLQVSRLAKRIQETIPETAPLIIAGDFNDWRTRRADVLKDELGMQEVFYSLYGDYAKTYPTRRPMLKVDRIYFRGLELQKGEVLQDVPWKNLSDHLPVYAEFIIPQ